ncbi:MAG TPA: hypothetical protein VKD72_17390, partial [Gemmataceae bacterium]|nr:hypothetical protein [Gemmataceae bacterium]
MKRFCRPSAVAGTLLALGAALLLPALARPQDKGDSGNARPEDRADSLRAKQQALFDRLNVAEAWKITVCMTVLPVRPFVSIHALPRRTQEVDGPTKGLLQPKGGGHRQVERERDGRLVLRHEEVAGEPAPAEALVERHQGGLADEQAEIDIPLLSEEVERLLNRLRCEPTPPKGRVRLDGAEAAYPHPPVVPPGIPEDHPDVTEGSAFGV